MLASKCVQMCRYVHAHADKYIFGTFSAPSKPKFTEQPMRKENIIHTAWGCHSDDDGSGCWRTLQDDCSQNPNHEACDGILQKLILLEHIPCTEMELLTIPSLYKNTLSLQKTVILYMLFISELKMWHSCNGTDLSFGTTGKMVKTMGNNKSIMVINKN